jgi:hypothetical protein
MLSSTSSRLRDSQGRGVSCAATGRIVPLPKCIHGKRGGRTVMRVRPGDTYQRYLPWLDVYDRILLKEIIPNQPIT